MPVKLLATNPFAEPARLEYEPSPSPAMRTYRWKRPLGVLPQYLRPTATNNNPRAPGMAGRLYSQGTHRTADVRQLFSMTQAATEHLKAAAQQGSREEARSCDLDAYRLGAPSYGANNNSNSNNTNNASQKSNSKTQLPNIKPDECSRAGFEHRLGRQTYSRTEVLLKLQRRKKSTGGPGSTGSPGDSAGGQRKDLPVINMREHSPNSCQASHNAREANDRSDSGCHSKDSLDARSRKSSLRGRRVTCTSLVSKIAHSSDSYGTEVHPCSSEGKGDAYPIRTAGPKAESDWRASEHPRRKLGFVEVTTSLHRDKDSASDEERSASTSSPVVSNDADSVCEELQKLVLARRTHQHLPAHDTPLEVCWQEDHDDTDSPDSDMSDKNRLVRAMTALQPPVPHVVWPENKYYSPHTVFVYASPSRLAPVVIPSHSVDCPQCKFYQASPQGDICPPNSPTPWMQKEYGFYPVERHFGSR